MEPINYFQSYRDYFWQWEDNEEVIAIPNSGTIAYRETILKVLSALAPHGLPPFGALILALIYTSNSRFKRYKTIEGYFAKVGIVRGENNDFDAAIRFLSILQTLDPEYLTGEKKLLLLITIFKDSHNRISLKKSKQILNTFNSANRLNLMPLKLINVQNLAYRDIRLLALLFKKYPTAKSIKIAMAGISDAEPEDFDLEDIDVLEDTGDDIVSQIIRNIDTFKSGALIKRIWSSANIPMHNKVPSGQPFGGVADITNKGNFDKLLISEFANEDVAFLSRLANREAMYFNREAPPSDNKEDRVIILDVSLKNWGTPKTIAFALMLAIAHHPKSKNNYVCYAVGRRPYKLNIDDIDGIVESAQVLDTSLSASQGLKELFSSNDFSNNEVFFISERSSSDVLDVAQVLTEHNHPIDYWMYPKICGEVDIFKKYRSGKKHHQSFKLPLNALWGKTPRVYKANFKVHEDTSNVFIKMLVPTPQNINYFIFSKEDLFVVTNDRQLLKKEYSNDGRTRKGWRVLHMQIPYIDCYHSIGRNEKGQYVLLSCFKNKDRLHLMNIDLNTSFEIVFSEHRNTRYKDFVYKDFCFHMILHSHYVKINMDGSFEKIEDKGSVIRKLVYENIKRKKDTKKIVGEVEQTLKRIHTVSINGGHLEINNHKLFLNGQGGLKLMERTSEFSESRISSRKISENRFRFKNGSNVVILKCGIIKLMSCYKSTLPVYFIPIIGNSISAYTYGTFAGNERYFIENKSLWRRDLIFNFGGQRSDIQRSFCTFIESEIKPSDTKIYHFVKVKEMKAYRKINMTEFYQKHFYKYITEIDQNDS